ncbi:MAG: LacI family transcriptional regulator [Verrucomicrobiae bacterium]|nr:LacI family transcriptional regulator [Verrucomicrobiae bacterium]
MRTGLYHNLGYFLDTAPGAMEENDFPEFRAGVFDAASARDFFVSLIRLPNRDFAKNPIPKAFREAHLDTLILNNMGGLTPELQQAILTSGFPIVYLNEKHDTNAVYFDDYEDTRMLTEYVIQRGYKRIAFFAENTRRPQHYSEQLRQAAFIATMQAHRLAPEVQRWHFREERTQIINWLRSAQRPQAVLCYRDRDALTLQSCATEAGLRIPQDLAVASASNEQRLDDYFVVPLTTLVQPRYDAAVAAVHMALDLVLDRKIATRPAKVYRATLREGESVPVRPVSR